MNIKEKFNEYIASGDPIISISDEQRDWILPFIERCVGEEREEGQKIAFLILPFAKGYVHANPHASSRRYIEIADSYLTQEDKIK